MTKRMTVLITVFAVLMLCLGLTLPGVIEWVSARSIGAQQSVSVEPIDFVGGSVDLFSVLNLINKSNSEIAYQPVKEGYRYTEETAAAHAADLLIAFLKNCGFTNAVAYWSDYLESEEPICEAMLIVVPDFPSPWTAILWTAEIQNGMNGSISELIFDDATGTLLGGEFFLAHENEKNSTQDVFFRTEQVAAAYADLLGAEYENLESQSWGDTEQLSTFLVKDNDGRYVLVRLSWLLAENGEIFLTLEPDGDVSYEEKISGLEPLPDNENAKNRYKMQ